MKLLQLLGFSQPRSRSPYLDFRVFRHKPGVWCSLPRPTAKRPCCKDKQCYWGRVHLTTQSSSCSMLMVPQLRWLIRLCQLGGWIMVLISRSLLWLWFVLCCVSDLYFRVICCWRHWGCLSQSSANRTAPHSTNSVCLWLYMMGTCSGSVKLPEHLSTNSWQSRNTSSHFISKLKQSPHSSVCFLHFHISITTFIQNASSYVLYKYFTSHI